MTERNEAVPDSLDRLHQHALASLGMAKGQCPDCGSYRSDGRPPEQHEPGCPHRPLDSSRYDPTTDWVIR